MKLTCPACHTLLPASQISVEHDAAVCPKCKQMFCVSKRLLGEESENELKIDIHHPPRGTWYYATATGWTVGASMRSGAAIIMVPFACFWVFGAVGLTRQAVANDEFSLTMIPLYGLVAAIVSFALLTVLGKVVVRVEGDQGTIFTGVGPIGWRRRFRWSSITDVEEGLAGYHVMGSEGLSIVLVAGEQRLKFGGALNALRIYFVQEALRKLLAERDALVPAR